MQVLTTEEMLKKEIEFLQRQVHDLQIKVKELLEKKENTNG